MSRIRMEPGSSPLSVERNFQRIENASEAGVDLDGGRTVFIGSITINTRLAKVARVVACIGVAPVAGACFVVAYPSIIAGGAYNQVTLVAYSNALALSVISTTVEWIATGEMVLG